jgi:hypothetical protein
MPSSQRRVPGHWCRLVFCISHTVCVRARLFYATIALTRCPLEPGLMVASQPPSAQFRGHLSFKTPGKLGGFDWRLYLTSGSTPELIRDNTRSAPVRGAHFKRAARIRLRRRHRDGAARRSDEAGVTWEEALEFCRRALIDGDRERNDAAVRSSAGVIRLTVAVQIDDRAIDAHAGRRLQHAAHSVVGRSARHRSGLADGHRGVGPICGGADGGICWCACAEDHAASPEGGCGGQCRGQDRQFPDHVHDVPFYSLAEIAFLYFCCPRPWAMSLSRDLSHPGNLGSRCQRRPAPGSRISRYV